MPSPEQLALINGSINRINQQLQEQPEPLLPERTGTTLEVATPFGRINTQIPLSEGVADFLIGAGRGVIRRTQRLTGADASIPAPESFAASIGDVAPTIPASFLFPAAGFGGLAAQGAFAAGTEALDPTATVQDIATEGAFGAAGQAGGDILGRTLGGAVNRVASRGRRIVPTRSPVLRDISETFGGMGRFNQQQQLVVNRAAVEALGETGDQLTPAIRNAAADRIGQVMDEALPTGVVDITDAFAQLDSVPGEVFPGKARVMRLVESAQDSPQSYQKAMSELRDTIRAVAKGGRSEFTDEIVRGFDALAEAGSDAGARNTRIVREQYKNLMLLESMPTVRNTGNVPPMLTANRIFTKFGAGTSRRGGAGTLPSTQRFIQTVQEASADLSTRLRSSGTAERALRTEAAEQGFGVLTGTTNPSTAARVFGGFTVAPVIGTASLGEPLENVARAGAAGVRSRRERNAADTDSR